MELVAVRLEAGAPGRRRLVGTVVYDDRPAGREEYWFEVSEAHAGSLSRTGNPWLVCLAPLATALGKPLRLCLPVDRLLFRNVCEAMAIWRSWYPELRPADVQASSVLGLPEAPGDRSGAMFSGGVDSFFTTLRSLEPGALALEDLIHVGGFDIRLASLEAFERRKARLVAAASELGKDLVDVVTNLRETRLERVGWGRVWHGAGLAAVGLALEGRYRRTVIASTHPYVDIHPLGSHPLTDPLFSSSRTRVLHDGAAFSRAEKTEYVSRFPVALKNLHVCFREGSDRNCGACEKCLRTMATLDVLGALPLARTFPSPHVDATRLSRVFVLKAGQEGYYRALRSLAVRRGRPEVARAIDRALRRSRWRRTALRIPDWLAGKHGLWRAAGPLRRAVLAREFF